MVPAPLVPLLRLIGWCGIAVATLLTIQTLVAVPGSRGVLDLSGLWTARVEGAPDRAVGLPGQMAAQGLPADRLIHLTRSVTVPSEGPLALWIDSPRWSAAASWDGVAVTPVPPAELTGRSVLAIVPASDPFSRHELDVTVTGGWGVASVGAVMLGPPDAVHALASRADARRVGVALILALAAAIPFAVRATRAQGATPHLALGLTHVLLAIGAWTTTQAAESLLGPLGAWRLSLVAASAVPLFAWSFLVGFLRIRPSAIVRRSAAAVAAVSASTVVLPTVWLARLESFPDLIALGTLPLCVPIVVTAWRLGRPTTLVVAATVGPPLLAVLGELALPDPWSSWSLAGTVLFAGATLAALVLRDVDLRDRHQRLLAGSGDGLVVVTTDGMIVDFGSGLDVLLGVQPSRQNLLALVHTDDRPIARAHLARALDREDRTEFRLPVEGRDRTIESAGRPHDAGRIQLVLRDVTQRKAMDQGLLHAARLETVAVLLGGIAHDFNNMLGTLLAHVGILQSTVSDTKAVERLGRMEATIERASQLTRRLLTVSRGSASSLGPVDLDRVLQAATDLVDPTLPRNIQLVVDVPDNIAPIHGDAQDLEQVLVNLLVNARDALKDGGTVRIAARPWAIEGGHRGVAIMVEDDGPGVPVELRSDIFQPFVTTKGRKGTGLGLAVASQILRDHQGRIWYEERPGGGARFLLALRHADALDEAPAPMPEGRRVLLVEDDEVLIEGYARALKGAGYTVIPFTAARDAARWLGTERPDVLVTDVVMEGMNGIELATLCQTTHPTVPILIVSGFIPDESVVALSAGTWHRLHKPVRAARLVSTVGRLRRRVERASRGEADITRVTWLFPPLDALTAKRLGLDEA